MGNYASINDKTSPPSYGLMQITDIAAKDIGGNLYTKYSSNPPVSKLDPSTNVNIGTAYIKKMEDSFRSKNSGDDLIKISLAAYNCGIGNIFCKITKNYPDKLNTV